MPNPSTGMPAVAIRIVGPVGLTSDASLSGPPVGLWASKHQILYVTCLPALIIKVGGGGQ
jgi:hypothetical protein